MGFGGSALAANQILRNNRAMLGKRKKKKLSFVAGKGSFIDKKQATPEQLQKIRETLKRRHKRRFRIRVIAAIIGIAVVTICIFFILTIDWSQVFYPSVKVVF